MRRDLAARLAGYRDTLGPQRRFLAQLIGEPSAEVVAMLERPRRSASVLIPIIDGGAGPTMLFTERAQHLAHHPGQVAFPGGRIESADPDALAAALREANEEVGLRPEQVDVLGDIGVHITGTGFAITPFVALVDPGFKPVIDASEVEAVFEVPLAFLLDPANCHRIERERLGNRFTSYEFHWDRWRIWGATAAMVLTLRDCLKT